MCAGGGAATPVGKTDAIAIVASCPEQATAKPDGNGPFNEHVMTKLSELQERGRIKIAFDRAGELPCIITATGRM